MHNLVSIYIYGLLNFLHYNYRQLLTILRFISTSFFSFPSKIHGNHRHSMIYSNKWRYRPNSRFLSPHMSRKKMEFQQPFSKPLHLLWGLVLLILWALQTNLKGKEKLIRFPNLLLSGKEKEESFPWAGVGLPPPALANDHVRVVVRVHHLQDAATRSLIWSMRAQATAVTHPSSDTPNFTVDVVLVATEEQGIPVVHKIARGTMFGNISC